MVNVIHLPKFIARWLCVCVSRDKCARNNTLRVIEQCVVVCEQESQSESENWWVRKETVCSSWIWEGCVVPWMRYQVRLKSWLIVSLAGKVVCGTTVYMLTTVLFPPFHIDCNNIYLFFLLSPGKMVGLSLLVCPWRCCRVSSLYLLSQVRNVKPLMNHEYSYTLSHVIVLSLFCIMRSRYYQEIDRGLPGDIVSWNLTLAHSLDIITIIIQRLT